MLLKTSNGTFIVKFRYDMIQTKRRVKSPIKKLDRQTKNFLEVPRTTCTIKPVGSDNVLASEHVQLYSADKFCRAEGRKRALNKALATSGLDRNTRSEIWEAYWLEVRPQSAATTAS